jgi:membrane glycosyltransferase
MVSLITSCQNSMLTRIKGDIRFGDFILIIDSDTQVPRDCLLDAASEMEQNPRTAILQYASVISLLLVIMRSIVLILQTRVS